VAEHPTLGQPDAGTRQFRFRTPTLRNVAMTAPYMHNGMLTTLDDVLRFYDNGRSENPNVLPSVARQRGDGGDRGGGGRRGDGDGVPRLDRRFVGVNDMSDDQMRDIVAFLASLSDTAFDTAIPAHVPSGLPPGGRIQTAAVR
jgi:cytochrome c peroxidase